MTQTVIQQKCPTFSLDSLLQGLGDALMKSIRDPFAIMNTDYHVLWINKAMAVIHGGNHKDAVGNVCYEYFHDGTFPCAGCPLNTVFKTGRIDISERHQDFPDGDRRWGKVKAYPVRDTDGSVVAAFVIVFDITDLKKTIDSQKKYATYLSRQLDAHSGKMRTIYVDGGDIAIQTRLTQREKDVLRLITEGYTNTQVSDTLEISPHTVKTHVIHIFNKLGVGDRTQAAVMAIRYKLI